MSSIEMVIALEEQPTKDGRNGEILAIGQVYNVCGGHDDSGGVARDVSNSQAERGNEAGYYVEKDSAL